jgi:hypothetical protein
MLARRWIHLLLANVLVSAPLGLWSACIAQTEAAPSATIQLQTQQDASGNYNDHAALENILPPSIAQNLDINAWGWFSFLHDSDREDPPYWLSDVALGATQRIGENFAATADVHFIDQNNESNGFVEQAFVTADALPKTGTLLSVGKFNANIGVEGRDEWDRFGGTTSLLFGAEPQDLIGVMLTQPIGDTGITVRPFVSTNFEGTFDFNAPPGGGAIVEYRPQHELSVALTNWVGPGYFGGQNGDGDDSDSYNEYPYDNWEGPDLNYTGTRDTLYLVDGHVTWLPTPDLTLSAEALLAMEGKSAQKPAWSGFLALVNYDITDRLRVFARWSYLNDNRWFVTYYVQTSYEISGGLGFEFLPGAEIRGEYRHDSSNKSGGVDSVSAHITFSY